MWTLSRKDPARLDLLLDAPESVLGLVEDEEPEGAFFPEATSKDAKRQEEEDSGMAAWLDRIREP